MYNRRFPFHHTPASGKRLDFIRIMIAIIAEKPSVGQDIARVVGATEKKDGYIVGNGYMVTWALGHLVSLALPDTYGYTRTAAEDLPMIPDPFRLVVRQVRTDRGMVTDIAAGRQLKVIGEVFAGCESIIVATDAGREGELIFRWIYSYLGCTKPFKRLWISSLTDEAIREGMASLKEGTGYDSLYAAADSRAKADWLVGMNASRALAAASGSVNNSIGRVQTPTLAMICARFKENRNFVSTPYWQLHIVLKRDNGHRQFIHTKEFKDKNMAEAAYKSITPGSVVTITKVKRRKIFQQAPLPYDLTALQKDCNIHYDLPVDKTLAITQSLYEKKLVSYPRTGSRYIPQDVMAHIPVLLEKITAMPEFREYRRSLDLSALNTRSVDAAKVTEHHALIITGIVPEGLSEAESTVYTLIAGRMLEAFSPPCEKELLLMECVCGGLDFHSRSTVIANPGWRAVFSRKEDREKDEPERDEGTASFTEGEEIPVMGRKYSINSLVYWVTYVHNVVYSFYRSMIYCYINSTQRCAGSIVIDIIPTNGADKRKFFPFAPYFPVTNVIKRYFYPYFPAIIGIKGYSFPYFPYLSGIMKIKTALYSLFSRLDWHKTVVFPCLGEIYEGIRSLSWEIPVT